MAVSVSASFATEKEVENIPLELPDDEHPEAYDQYVGNLFSEEGLSRFNIINMDDFHEKLQAVVSDTDEYEVNIDNEEVKLLDTIREFENEAREDPSKVIWVCLHTNYLVEYYIKTERFDDALLNVEENLTKLNQVDKKNKIVMREYFVSHLLKGEILVKTGQLEDGKKEWSYALELYPSGPDVWGIAAMYVRYFKEAKELVEE